MTRPICAACEAPEKLTKIANKEITERTMVRKKTIRFLLTSFRCSITMALPQIRPHYTKNGPQMTRITQMEEGLVATEAFLCFSVSLWLISPGRLPRWHGSPIAVNNPERQREDRGGCGELRPVQRLDGEPGAAEHADGVVSGVEQHSRENRTRHQCDRCEHHSQYGGRRNPVQRHMKYPEDQSYPDDQRGRSQLPAQTAEQDSAKREFLADGR